MVSIKVRLYVYDCCKCSIGCRENGSFSGQVGYMDVILSSSSFRSSTSELTMRLLKDFSRSLCFWSPRPSWSSRFVLPQVFPDIVHPDLSLSPSASLSLHVSM